MSFYAYMLRFADGRFHVGHSDDLEKRVAEHESGLVPGFTQERRPVKLVWSENFPTREEAIAAELRINGWTRRKKEALILGDWETIRREAVPPAEREARALRLRSG